MLIGRIRKSWGLFSCDVCCKEHERKIRPSYVPKYNFCSRECALSPDAILLTNAVACETNLKRYGVTSVWKSKDVREKAKITSLANYGTESPTQSDVVKLKIKTTNLERYGVENVFQAEQIKEKCTQSLIEHYGVEHALQSPIIQEKFKKTCQENLGVDYPGQSKIVQEKAKITFLERYGVDHNFKIESLKEDRKNSMLENYGVEYNMQRKDVRDALNSPEAWDKRISTMKCNNTFVKSKPEDKFYSTLCELYGEENVERQIHVYKHWIVDFYVKHIEVYVQFDGVYWHGLDRDITKIAEHKTKRDVGIHKKWKSDRRQDEWFIKNNKNLVRFNEKEVEQWQNEKTIRQQVNNRMQQTKK